MFLCLSYPPTLHETLIQLLLALSLGHQTQRTSAHGASGGMHNPFTRACYVHSQQVFDGCTVRGAHLGQVYGIFSVVKLMAIHPQEF